MEHGETLRTLAEVATAFAGFSGVVVVLGHRVAPEWKEGEKLRLGLLLLSSLGVVFFAFVPLLVNAASVPVWRISNGLLGGYHFAILGWTVNRGRPLEPMLASRWLLIVAMLVGLVSVAFNLIVLAGLVQSLAPFVYLAGLVWLLVVATFSFAALLFGSRPAA